MSRIHVDDIYDNRGVGSPLCLAGIVVTGVTTSTSFSGRLTGNGSSATVTNGLQGYTKYHCWISCKLPLVHLVVMCLLLELLPRKI